MLKKSLIFLLVFSFILSFSFITCSALTEENLILNYSAADLYNVCSSPDYSSGFSNLAINNTGDEFVFVRSSSRQFTKYYWDSFDPHTNKRFESDNTNVTIVFQIVTAYDENGNPSSFDYPRVTGSFNVIRDNVKGFAVIIGGNSSGDFSYFKGFEIYEVPDDLPAGNVSDFNTYLMPLITSLSTQTWEVFSNCWWALALVLLPLVYLIIVSVINLFRFVAFKISPKYKLRFIEKFKVKYDYYNTQPFKFTFRNFGIGRKKKKPPYNRYVYIDGVRYYAPNYNKKHNFKNSFDKKTDYSDKKYDFVDIEVD